MASVATVSNTMSAPSGPKKTRRGMSKKNKTPRIANEADMNVDEDSALRTNNTIGIVSVLENPDQDIEVEPLASFSLPTASASQTKAALAAINDQQDDNEEDQMVLDTAVQEDAPEAASGQPTFKPLSASAHSTALRSEMRRIPIPPHRMTPLKKDWVNIFVPLTEMAGLQVRMNVHRRCVEMRTSKATKEMGALQKGADFVKAYALGFEVNDAIALLRMDDLYIDTFEIKDVKTLHGDHLSRAIGRIAGQDGKTKFTIENASRTRIVLADTKIHILGSFQNIKIARDAIVSLILGSPPGKVYASLRTIGARMKQRAM